MNNFESYIKNCLISEHADKNFEDGWSLDINSIPKQEIHNFLDMLMENDPMFRRDTLDYMQSIIDDRMRDIEVDCRYESGIRMTYTNDGDSQLKYTNNNYSGY
jgi:hypothetical protein